MRRTRLHERRLGPSPARADARPGPAVPQEQETWSAPSRASLARLWAYFLLGEDPQRRLDAATVSTLAHQVSLVRHILDSDPPQPRTGGRRGGPGQDGRGRPAGEGVARAGRRGSACSTSPRPGWSTTCRSEFDRLGLGFRQWSTSAEVDGRLDDPRLIASIHRAVHPQALREPPPEVTAWDVLIVDECHHLSDWAPGRGRPNPEVQAGPRADRPGRSRLARRLPERHAAPGQHGTVREPA